MTVTTLENVRAKIHGKRCKNRWQLTNGGTEQERRKWISTYLIHLLDIIDVHSKVIEKQAHASDSFPTLRYRYYCDCTAI